MIVSTNVHSGRDVVYQLTAAVAERTDTEISALPPLYETIDTDALDAFLHRSNGTDARPEWSLEFPYCGYHVTVDSTGEVRLHQESESRAATSDTGGRE